MHACNYTVLKVINHHNIIIMYVYGQMYSRGFCTHMQIQSVDTLMNVFPGATKH